MWSFAVSDPWGPGRARSDPAPGVFGGQPGPCRHLVSRGAVLLAGGLHAVHQHRCPLGGGHELQSPPAVRIYEARAGRVLGREYDPGLHRGGSTPHPPTLPLPSLALNLLKPPHPRVFGRAEQGCPVVSAKNAVPWPLTGGCGLEPPLQKTNQRQRTAITDRELNL